MKMRSSELAEAFGFSQPCVRRWAREFLPPEPRAQMRTGFRREHGPKEALSVLVGGMLVQNVPFNFHDARQVVQVLIPRLLTGSGQAVNWERLCSIRFLEISRPQRPMTPAGRTEVLEYVALRDGFLQDSRFSSVWEAWRIPVSVTMDVGRIFPAFSREFHQPVPGGRGQA